MTIVDLILAIVVGLFVLFGLFFGFIHTLGSLLGAVLGIYISSRINAPIVKAFGFLFGGGFAAQIIIFSLSYVIIGRLVGFLFWILDNIFKFVSILPFIKSINRLAGGLLGFLEGVIIVGAVMFFALAVLPEGSVRSAISDSKVASYILNVLDFLKILYPDMLKKVNDAIPQVL